MIAARVPYLATLTRARLRSGVMSFALGLAISGMSVAELFVIRIGGGTFRDIAFPLFVGQIMFAVGIPITIAIALGRERDTGRLLAAAQGPSSDWQILAGLLIGPAWIEWIGLVGCSVGGLHYPEHLDAARVGFIVVGAPGMALLAAGVQLRRSDRFRGQRIAAAITAAWIVAYASWSLSVLDSAWVRPHETWRLRAVLACLIVLLARHVRSLIRRRPPGTVALVVRFGTPALAALLFAAALQRSNENLMLAVGVVVGSALMAAAVSTWEADAYREIADHRERVPGWSMIAVLAGVAVLASVWRYEMFSLSFSHSLAELVRWAAIPFRFRAYLALLAWTRRRYPTWQPLILTATFSSVTLAAMGLARFVGGPSAIFIAEVLSSEWGLGNPSDSRSETADFLDRVDSSAIAIAASLMVIWTARPRRSPSPSSESASQVHLSPIMARTRRVSIPIGALARLSPLLAAQTIVNVRSVSLTSTLPLLLPISVLGVVGFDAVRGNDLVKRWSLVGEVVYVAPVLVAASVFAAMGRDRASGLLSRNAFTNMRPWQVAVGYLMGSPASGIAALVFLSIIGLILGGRAPSPIHAVEYTLVVVLWTLCAVGAAAIYQTRPPAPRGQLVPLGAIFFSFALIFHVALAFYGERPSMARDLLGVATRGPGSTALLLERTSGAAPSFPFPLACLVALLAVLLTAVVARRIYWIEGKAFARNSVVLVPPVAASIPLITAATERSMQFVAATMTGFVAAVVCAYLATGARGIVDASRRPVDLRRLNSAVAAAAVTTLLVSTISVLHSPGNGLVTKLAAIASESVVLAVRLIMYAAIFRLLARRFPTVRFAVATMCYLLIEFVPLFVLPDVLSPDLVDHPDLSSGLPALNIVARSLAGAYSQVSLAGSLLVGGGVATQGRLVVGLLATLPSLMLSTLVMATVARLDGRLDFASLPYPFGKSRS